MPHPIVTPPQPDPGQSASIRALISAVHAEDGRAPLSDQALTHLASADVEHALVVDGHRVLGYAQLDRGSLEIAAEPDAIGPLLQLFADQRVLVWSHGKKSRLVGALVLEGFTPARQLHQLRRPLQDRIVIPPEPDGVRIRPFTVGTDEDAWQAVNAAAFAAHPEQGGWTRADLEAREHEDWFDPAGFLLAWRAGQLLGFHWTKIHPDAAGEVYVLGVDPAAQGIGLGAVLLLRGLAHLRERGCPEALLYVDGSNTGAIRLYERYGFHAYDLDVQWQSPQSRSRGQSTATGSVSNT